MDRTTNESKKVYDYISRYTKFPYYYQELDQKYFYGITDHLNKNITFLVHKVNDYDTLDLLALNYYGGESEIFKNNARFLLDYSRFQRD